MSGRVTKIAVACQGGGTHAAFEVGVLTEILKAMDSRKEFDLVGLSGTSAGALCATMVWYGLAPKKGHPESGSVAEAIQTINTFWDRFAASTTTEITHNALCMAALSAQELEVPVLGVNMPVFSINPNGILDDATIMQLRQFGAREEYYDFDAMLTAACPHFHEVDWPKVHTRVLIGASEIVNGIETVFDSDCNRPPIPEKHTDPSIKQRWRARLPLSLSAVAASGTLPGIRKAEKIDGGYYWDGLYSQNPPIREFLSGISKDYVPDEIWVLRINPQECTRSPRSTAEAHDRENELMGNLSLNKELDFIQAINHLIQRFPSVAEEYKPVTVRTIKMTKETAGKLRTASKFNRSRSFIDELREEGTKVARAWLQQGTNVGCYPNDAAY